MKGSYKCERKTGSQHSVAETAGGDPPIQEVLQILSGSEYLIDVNVWMFATRSLAPQSMHTLDIG